MPQATTAEASEADVAMASSNGSRRSSSVSTVAVDECPGQHGDDSHYANHNIFRWRPAVRYHARSQPTRAVILQNRAYSTESACPIALVNTLTDATAQALRLVATADPNLVGIVLLSLRISLAAVVFGCLIGLPLGAAIAVNDFRGRRAVIVILNGLMGLPSVVVGLAVYLLLSRAGPLGAWGILFTPTAMVIAQTILITPTIAALSRQIVADAWQEYREQLRSLGETRLGAATTLLWDLRFSLVTIVLAGFGRAASEVGAVMIVGGNIDGVTRVMTTTIALETSKGDLPLALGLGFILLSIVLALNAGAYVVKETAQRRYG